MPLTLDQLIAAEPALAELIHEAQTLHVEEGARYCGCAAYADGYGGHASFRDRLERLVGWGRKGDHEFLRTSEAFAVARKGVLAALQPCHPFCGCHLVAAAHEAGRRKALAAGSMLQEYHPVGNR